MKTKPILPKAPLLAALALLSWLPLAAHAQIVDHSGGFWDNGDLAANQSYYYGPIFTGGVARLTNAFTNPQTGDVFGYYETGSIFTYDKVDITNFTNVFTFQMLNGTDFSADGLTFTIQNDNPFALGETGGGLGYRFVPSSFAVTFDLYDNAGEGYNSTGVYANGEDPWGSANFDLNGTGIDLHSQHPFQVSMNYDGIGLDVTLLDLLTNLTATQFYTVDIPSLIGTDQAHVGFTAATGGLTATQNIYTWRYESHPFAAPPPPPSTAIPEPGTISLLLIAAIPGSLTALRRRHRRSA